MLLEATAGSDSMKRGVEVDKRRWSNVDGQSEKRKKGAGPLVFRLGVGRRRASQSPRRLCSVPD
jgi:hypothetical protein